jgi:hypothetical protein
MFSQSRRVSSTIGALLSSLPNASPRRDSGLYVSGRSCLRQLQECGIVREYRRQCKRHQHSRDREHFPGHRRRPPWPRRRIPRFVADGQTSSRTRHLLAFGPSKAGNPEVIAIIAEIIRRFDIVAVQEIRDSTGEAVVTLRTAVNATGARYEYVIGPREGRTSSKEQYAFFYNTSTIAVLPGA